jgi:hypothetical protein
MKKNHNIFFLITALLFLQQPLIAQLLTVKAETDTNAILIGDQVNFQFEVTKPKEMDVRFPQLSNSLADGIEILENKGMDTVSLEDNKQRLIQTYAVTAFDSGLFYIPPFEFPFEYENISDTIETKAGYLEVFTVPVDLQADIKDIKEPYKAPITFMEILPYLLGGMVLAFIIILLIKYFSRKKVVDKGELVQKPKEPPHVLAFRELESLKKKKLWQKGKIKEYYSELTEIIRRYIELRFEIKAMEETSEEIFEEFRNRKFDKELYFELLRQLLIKADLVKFAKDHPLPDENETYFNHAFSFVEHSKKEEILNDHLAEKNGKMISLEEKKKEINE